MHPARSTVVAVAFALGMLWNGAARAEPDLGRARDAYDRGVRAHAAADYATAARAFAEADALAPTTASLEAALEAAMRADDAALGAELLERANSRAERDAALSKTIEAAKKRFAGRTGTIRAECKPSERCLIAVDGHASDASRPVFAAVGTHTVVLQQGEARFERLVDVRPDAVTVVTFPTWNPGTALPKGPERSPKPMSSTGLSPVWFYIGAAATVLTGTAAVASGLDAEGKHDDFVAARCNPGATGPKDATCASRADEGKNATLRTNLLIGATAFFAVTTATLGIVFVRWSPEPSGGVATIGGRF